MTLRLCAALLALPTIALAQSPACAGTTIHFEYQMAPPARWLRDTIFGVHPTVAVGDPANLIRFVIDTLGVPEPRTFRALKVADSLLVADARRTFSSWRYAPGLLSGCRVRQLAQTPIGR